ncbi:MAG: hydroxymethylbilane synthase [Parafilimonas sp.]
MANSILRIGTRESPLAVWQATQVQHLLIAANIQSQLVYIKSEGDTDTITPLYALGVQGIFTKTLDAALLNNRIDIAVHSLKDVPVQMAEGIIQAAVLKRGNYKDIFVYKDEADLKKLGFINNEWTTDRQSQFLNHDSSFTIATSSIRRIAQWENRYPNTTIQNLRGNVNTRLRKLKESEWNGAIFAAAGLERINLRPKNAIDLDWMLPAPAQGAIAVVCKKDDEQSYNFSQSFNDKETALCVKLERDFLRALSGGCSTPISALAIIKNNQLVFKGSVLSTDGKQKMEIEKKVATTNADDLGIIAGEEILSRGADKIIEQIRNAHT